MPAACGWHLPQGGGAEALADTLRTIAHDPHEIARRGAAAARFMSPRTATAYADGLAAFLHAGQTRMARRASLARTRSTCADPLDRDWHASYAQVRGVMAGMMAGRGLLPPDLWSGSDHEIGQYVSLNLLNSAVSDPAHLGRALTQGGLLKATERLGLLRVLLARACGTPMTTGHHLSDLALPIRDAALWTVILALPPGIAVPMGLQALGQRPPPEAQTRLADLACRHGIGAALVTWLDGRGEALLDQADMAAIRRILHRPQADRLRPLPPLTSGTDLIHVAREPDQDALHLDGFHAPEDTGIWTARAQASIRALSDPDHPVTRLAGTAALLEAALAHETLTLTVTATEERTGRRATWSDTRPRGSDPALDWDLPLPEFSGPLRIDLSLPTCHSPRDLGVSADPRPLGLLLHSLRMESAHPRLAAAE